MTKKRSKAAEPLGMRIEGDCVSNGPDGEDRIEFAIAWRSSLHPEAVEAFEAATARLKAIDPDDETLGERGAMLVACVERTFATITANLGRIADDLEFARKRAAQQQAALKARPAPAAKPAKRAPKKA